MKRIKVKLLEQCKWGDTIANAGYVIEVYDVPGDVCYFVADDYDKTLGRKYRLIPKNECEVIPAADPTPESNAEAIARLHDMISQLGCYV